MQANLHEKLEEARARASTRSQTRTLAQAHTHTHTHTHAQTQTHAHALTHARTHARTHPHERTPARAGGQSGGRRGHCEHSLGALMGSVALQMCGSLQEAVDAKGLYLEHLARTVAASHAKLKQQARPGAPLDCPSSTP
jgi:hypothetical protein